MHVLLVQDEQELARLLKHSLEEENHCVGLAFDGREALEMAEALEFDAIVLSLMLPGTDGFEVARRLRGAGNTTPILALGTRGAVRDVVRGLDLGVDDYMARPFFFEEFLARLRSISRRAPVPPPVALQVGDLVLHPASRDASRAGKRISLSPTEYCLLEFLMRRAGRILPRETIIQSVWGSPAGFEKNTLHSFIKNLRNKIDRGCTVKLVETDRGFGYGIRAPGLQESFPQP